MIKTNPMLMICLKVTNKIACTNIFNDIRLPPPLCLILFFYPIRFHSGNFSRLTVNFRFERQIGHHLIQTFAPSTLVVMLSWFSFWLGLDAIPGRVTLLVTCMLTLVTMFTGLRADIPPVAYVKVSSSILCLIFSSYL